MHTGELMTMEQSACGTRELTDPTLGTRARMRILRDERCHFFLGNKIFTGKNNVYKHLLLL